MEQKHQFESDMTAKEKRQAEIAKLKAMTFKERVAHMWSYHKLIVLAPVILVVLVIAIGQYIVHLRYQDILTIGVVDSAFTDGAAVGEELRGLLGVEDPYALITVDSSYRSSEGNLDPDSLQKFVVLSGAGALDLFISDTDVFEMNVRMRSSFLELSEVLDADVIASLNIVDEYGIDISGTRLAEILDIPYQPAILAVIPNRDLLSYDREGIQRIERVRTLVETTILEHP